MSHLQSVNRCSPDLVHQSLERWCTAARSARWQETPDLGRSGSQSPTLISKTCRLDCELPDCRIHRKVLLGNKAYRCNIYRYTTVVRSCVQLAEAVECRTTLFVRVTGLWPCRPFLTIGAILLTGRSRKRGSTRISGNLNYKLVVSICILFITPLTTLEQFHC